MRNLTQGDIQEEQLERSFPAAAESIRTARDTVVAFAACQRLTPEQLESIRLAVSEAVTNAVLHAYPDGRGQVHVAAGVAGGELHVLITDDGCGFQTPSQKPGLGWGLPLIADASDHFTIAERSHRGTEVRLRFVLPGRRSGARSRPKT